MTDRKTLGPGIASEGGAANPRSAIADAPGSENVWHGFREGDRVLVRPESRSVQRDHGREFIARVSKVFPGWPERIDVEPEAKPSEDIAVGAHVLTRITDDYAA